MRRLLAAVVFLLVVPSLSGRVVSAEGVVFDAVDAPFSAVLEKAKPLAADRLLLVEFYTARCGLCRALERETFDSHDVATALKGDLCVRYDAEGDAGRPVAERFRVHNFPTTLFLDAGGEEVDRVIGFQSPNRFVEEISRIRAGTDTLKSLRAAHSSASAGPKSAVALGRKLARAGDVEAARGLLEPVATAAVPDASVRPSALLGLAELSFRANDSRPAFERIDQLIEAYPESPEAVDAKLLRVDLHLRDGSFEKAIAAAADARLVVTGAARLARLEETVATLERKRLSDTIERWGERAQAAGDVESLHRASVAALERGLSLGSAVRWAESAAKSVPDDASYLETWAALLFETQRPEKALSVGEKALELSKEVDERTRIARRVAAWRASYQVRTQVPPLVPAGDALPAPNGGAGMIEPGPCPTEPKPPCK